MTSSLSIGYVMNRLSACSYKPFRPKTASTINHRQAMKGRQIKIKGRTKNRKNQNKKGKRDKKQD